MLSFVLGADEALLFWIDVNNPYTMYTESFNGNWLFADGSNYETKILTKDDAAPNEPEENFLSIFKLHEMSKEYGVDYDTLVSFTYDNEGGKEQLHHNDRGEFYPVYLVSEAPDKLVLKTTVGNLYSPDEEAAAEYTIEKINGEWVRTIQFGA